MAEQKTVKENALAPAQVATDIGVGERNITDSVLARITSMLEGKSLQLPPNYSPANALRSAYLKLLETKDREKNPVLQVCTRESIANALLNMVIQGLTPAKTQCYFVAYGKELQMTRSYFGTIAVLKRLSNVEDVFSEVIYADDEFEYTIQGGNKIILKHEQKLANIDTSKIVGAYATIVRNGKSYSEIMSKAQIDVSWSKRKNNGDVQKEFPEEMAKRTVINRASKMFVNTSDDSDLLAEAINASTRDEYEPDALSQSSNTAAIQGNQQPIVIIPEDIPSLPTSEGTKVETQASKQEHTANSNPPF